MAIQLLIEIPAICENEECKNYQYWETVYEDNLKKDQDGNDYVLCPLCKEKITIK